MNSQLDEAEDWISVLEDKVEKHTQAEQQKEIRILKNEESLRNIWDNIKHNNIHITEYQKRVGKGSRTYLKK